MVVNVAATSESCACLFRGGDHVVSMKIWSLLLFLGLAIANAQELEVDLLATIEIRGIDKAIREVAPLMHALDEDAMEPEDIKAIFGAMVMSQDGIDFDKTLRLFAWDEELNPEKLGAPPVILALPLKGDEFLKSLALSMSRRAGAKPDESHFSPKPGGAVQVAGVPSLSSFTFHTKVVGKTVFLGPNLKQVRAIANQPVPQRMLPGTINIDVDAPKLIENIESNVSRMTGGAFLEGMLNGQMTNLKDQIKQRKAKGLDASGLESELAKLNELMLSKKAFTERRQSLTSQMDRLQISLSSENDLLTLYTLITPKAKSSFAEVISKMHTPSDLVRHPGGKDAFFTYVGHLAQPKSHLSALLDLNCALRAIEEAGKKQGRVSDAYSALSALLRRHAGGDLMVTINNARGRPEAGLAFEVGDSGKALNAVKVLAAKTETLNLPYDKSLTIKQTSQRKIESREVVTYETKVDGGKENEKSHMMDRKSIELGRTTNHLLIGSGGESFNSLAAMLSKGGSIPFESSGAFAKNFPTLKAPPVSMYQLDLMTLLHLSVRAKDPRKAAQIPAQGATLTGWSNKLRGNFLHVDRISIEEFQRALTAWKISSSVSE